MTGSPRTSFFLAPLPRCVAPSRTALKREFQLFERRLNQRTSCAVRSSHSSIALSSVSSSPMSRRESAGAWREVR